MGVLKKCVRNRARPEGSIASAYGTEEVIDFCVDFIDDLKPIGVPESRYERRLSGKGTLRKKSHICTDDDSFKKAHYAVLQQSSLVDPYIEEHKKIVTSEFPEKSETWITCQHIDTFGSWLWRHLMHIMDIGEQLFLLSRGPSWNILTYQGYEINGNTFYTAAQDKKTQIKIVVCVWTPQTAMEKRRHCTVTLKRYGNWITVPISRCLCFGASR